LERVEFRKALGHQLLAARPEPDRAGALDPLSADAIPFPFDHPLVDRPERIRRIVQLVRQKKRVRLAGIGDAIPSGSDQRGKTCRAGDRRDADISDDARRSSVRRPTRPARITESRDTPTPNPADQLAESPRPVELVPVAGQALPIRRRRCAEAATLLDPFGQPGGALVGGGGSNAHGLGQSPTAR
jgi:hypothetical protein